MDRMDRMGRWACPMVASSVVLVGHAHGQCESTPPFLEDEMALDYNGVNGYVKVPSAPGLMFGEGEAITLEAWVFPEILTGQHNVISKSSDSTTNYALRYEIDGSIGFFYRNASDTTWYELNSEGGVVSAGEWNHIAVAHTFGTAEISVYVNGALVSGGWSGTPTEGPMTTGESLLFGATAVNPGDTPTRLVDGRIDEIRIWSTIRAHEEILADMSVILTGAEPGLTAYWRFEEGAGFMAADLAGGHTSTLVGATWFELGECALPCPEDVDDSDDIGFTDLLSILSNWGPCDASCPEDVDLSGDVGFTDLLAVLGNWGPCPVATGACCLPGECRDLPADVCIDMGGVYTTGQSCADTGCPGDDGWIVTAPLVWSGDTCAGDDDCGLEVALDELWEITIPASGTWTFSVCGAIFDTVLYLGSSPCTFDLGNGDDECVVASEIQVDLDPGTYFLALEGFASSDCGDFTLVVTDE